MTFLGMLVFFDPPKAGEEGAIRRLRELGVSLKIMAGDNHLAAANTCNTGYVLRRIISSTLECRSARPYDF